MSDKLTPEEIAAFCDAVEWYAINHRDRALSANKFAAQCDLETRWDVVLRILPKIRALAAPAAEVPSVPMSELRELIRDWNEYGGVVGHETGACRFAIEVLIAKHSKEGA